MQPAPHQTAVPQLVIELFGSECSVQLLTFRIEDGVRTHFPMFSLTSAHGIVHNDHQGNHKIHSTEANLYEQSPEYSPEHYFQNNG